MLQHSSFSQVERRPGEDCRCQDHRRSVLKQGQTEEPRPGDASDQEGKPAALRDDRGLVHALTGAAADEADNMMLLAVNRSPRSNLQSFPRCLMTIICAL